MTTGDGTAVPRPGSFFTDRFADTKLDSKLIRSEAEAAWIAARIGGPRVLDLGCGRGRLSIPLARLGKSVTGVDINARYLEVARERAEEAGVAISWRCAADDELTDAGEFDGAISMFTSFGYHSDERNRDVLHRCARALRPGGLLLLETQNRDAPRVFELASTEEDAPDGQRILKTYSFEPRTSRMNMLFEYRKDGEVVEVGRLDYRIYSVHEMLVLLSGAGFDTVELFGNARGAAYNPTGDHIVYIGRKS